GTVASIIGELLPQRVRAITHPVEPLLVVIHEPHLAIGFATGSYVPPIPSLAPGVVAAVLHRPMTVEPALLRMLLGEQETAAVIGEQAVLVAAARVHSNAVEPVPHVVAVRGLHVRAGVGGVRVLLHGDSAPQVVERLAP